MTSKHKIVGSGATTVTSDSSGNITISSTDTNTDTKVTSVGNHYAPVEDSTAQLSVDAVGTAAATWGTTNLVTGVNLQRDAKGHVTGITVDSIQMPANPDTNTWRKVQLNGTDKLGTGTSTNPLNIKNGTGISITESGGAFTFGHSNSVTAGTASGSATGTLTFGGTFTIPSITYDAQGHITGKSTTILTMPANPNVDTKVTQAAAITTAGNYPLILGYSTATTAVTNTVNKTSTLYYNPSTTLLTAPKYSVNSKVTLEYNATDDSLDFIFV